MKALIAKDDNGEYIPFAKCVYKFAENRRIMGVDKENHLFIMWFNIGLKDQETANAFHNELDKKFMSIEKEYQQKNDPDGEVKAKMKAVTDQIGKYYKNKMLDQPQKEGKFPVVKYYFAPSIKQYGEAEYFDLPK